MTTIAAPAAGIEMRSAPLSLDTEQTGLVDIDIPYAAIGDPDKLLLTGLGETDVAGIAERLTQYGVTGFAVASLVYPSVKGRLSGEVVEQSIIGGTEALVHDITGNGHGVHQAVGISEGASQLVIAAHRKPALYGQVVAIAPNGLNNEALGDTPKDQARELLERFKRAELTVGADVNALGLMKEVMGGLAYAEEHDATEVVAALGDRLRIYIGEDDVVVPPEEAEAGVGPDRIIRVPGMDHPTLLNEAGCYQASLIMQREWTAGIVK
jgi:hypothetical protein